MQTNNRPRYFFSFRSSFSGDLVDNYFRFKFLSIPHNFPPSESEAFWDDSATVFFEVVGGTGILETAVDTLSEESETSACDLITGLPGRLTISELLRTADGLIILSLF